MCWYRYFTVWCGYPIAWILKEVGVLSPIASALVHVFLDVAAKALYGIALVEFQLGADKYAFIFIPLHPGIDNEQSDGAPKGAMVGSSAQINAYDYQGEDLEASNPIGAYKKKGAPRRGSVESIILDPDLETPANGGQQSRHVNGDGGGPEGETPMQKAKRLVQGLSSPLTAQRVHHNPALSWWE